MRKNFNLIAAFAFLICAGLSQFSSAIADEAVDCRACVGKDQLERKAVTRSKISNGAVNWKKLSDGAVSSEKLQDRAVTKNKIRNGAVTGAKLSAGAVSEIHVGFANSIFVGANGASGRDNCDNLKAALDEIGDSPGAIILGPGRYDCGLGWSAQLETGQALVGAGPNLTFLTGREDRELALEYMIRARPGSSVSSLTIEFDGGRGLEVFGPDSRVIDVVLRGSEAGLWAGSNCAGLTIDRVQAYALQDGMILECSPNPGTGAPILNNIVAVGENLSGLFHFGGPPLTHVLRNSVVKGGRWGIFQARDPGDIVAVATQIDGDIQLQTHSTITCVASYDGDFLPLDTDCN